VVTSASSFPDAVTPTATDTRLAGESLPKITRYLETVRKNARVHISKDNETAESIVLPLTALRLLKEILSEMAKGNSIALLPLQAELTTQQVADLLNVSRPYVVGLLEAKKIPCRRVGKHRRVRLDDVLTYKRKDDEARLRVLEELVAQAQELNMGY
jgi:excisionase family DNA binding protein